MSEYGEGWIENEDGDVVVPDDALFDDMSSESLDGLGTEAEKKKLEETHGPGYLDTLAHIEWCLEASRGFRDGPKILMGKDWVPIGEYAAVELFRLESRGQLTKKGRQALMLRLGIYVPTHNTKISNSRKQYRDVRSAAANDFDED